MPAETKEVNYLEAALQFIKFTDRAIGNKFEAALKELLRDLDDGNYDASSDAEKALLALKEEVDDALEKLAEEEEVEEEEEELEEEEEEIEEEEEEIDPLDDAMEEELEEES